PEIKEIAISPEAFRERSNPLALIENLVNLIRNVEQLAHVPFDFMLRQRLVRLRQLQSKKVKGGKLGCECLCRSDAYLGSGMRIQNSIRLPGGLAADYITNRKQESPFVPGFFHRRQCIGCFTGLADPDYQA